MNKHHNRQAINNDIKNSMALLLHPDPTLQQQAERNTHIRTMTIPASLINRELQILNWRYKTSLPVVKPIEFSLHQNPHSSPKNNNLQSSSSCNFFSNKTFQKQSSIQANPQIYSPREKETMCEFVIQIEDIKCRLSDIGLLPFTQILYLLKEMMIGYDVLIDKFGTFSPSENMVAVTVHSQWKMWINQDFFKNSKEEQKSGEIGVREFIYCLILLAEKHCTATSQSKLFFNDIKEYTYSKNCGFVKILEKIKEFSIANKIFQANKVILPIQRAEKTNKELNFNLTCNNSKNISNNESFNSNRPQSKLRMQKKLSFQQQISNFTPKSPTTQHMIKSSFQNMEHQNFKSHNFIPQSLSPTNYHLQQCRSQKVINNSSFFYNPLQAQPLSYCLPNTKKVLNRNETMQPNSFQAHSNFNYEKKRMEYSYLPNYGEKKPQSMFRSPEIRSKPQSPQAHKLQNKNSSFMNFTKSRQELKNLVSQTPQVPSNKLLKPPQQSRPKQRKYSEQIFKAKSVDALSKVAKKIYGSNIYEQDPEIKQNGVNVIKVNPNVSKFNFSPTKKITTNLDDTNKQYSAGMKGPDSSTPNNSSNSTQQLQNSLERGTNKASNYQYLKANDLNKGRIRNNQSSCYGMGGYTEQQKRQKNMVVSCSFRNRDEDSEKSESQEKGERAAGNNWTKKISGLFSDDASIKHLKGSVKFKTAQEERFQKQYLKDVKLEMLQKFGRPVRHSIVDEQDDFGTPSKNPYKSMQLIEEAMDQGKSYVEKDDKEEEVQEEMPAVRGRHHTVQVYNYKKQDDKSVTIQHRECVYYECSQNDSQQQFNFQSEGYVINKK